MFAVQEGKDITARCTINISKDGWFSVWGKHNDERKLLLHWEESKHIKRNGKTNTLRMAKAGREITVWINGHDVASVGNRWITAGQVGIFGSTPPTESVAQARFKGFEVQAIE